jgi:hypothetical protein
MKWGQTCHCLTDACSAVTLRKSAEGVRQAVPQREDNPHAEREDYTYSGPYRPQPQAAPIGWP